MAASATACSMREAPLGHVRGLLCASTAEQEAQALGQLVVFAKSLKNELVPSLWCGDGEDLRKLFVYCMTRCFAPRDVSVASLFKGDTLILAQSMRVLRVEGASRPQELLDAMAGSKWPTEFLANVSATLKDTEEPRVRQLALHFVLKAMSQQVEGASSGWVQASMDALFVAVTDVWSAIRKESARSASSIALQFPAIEQIDFFIESLLKIAMVDTWKAQEGALMTLGCLISSIQIDKVTGKSASTSDKAHETSAVDMIKGGSVLSAKSSSVCFHVGTSHRNLPQLPRSLAFKLKPALYVALKHSQVCVRDAAATCLVHLLGISDESTRVLMFQEVMSKLNRLSSADETSQEMNGELLDASEAEGLLDVLAKLVPRLPLSFLVKHWKIVFPTLERYVVHIASSVRLRSSSVILALGELSVDANANGLSLELLYQTMVALAHLRDVVGVCWQRLEGRLLSIDLLVGLFGKENLWRVDRNLLHVASEQERQSLPTAERWLSSTMRPQATWSLDEEAESFLASLSTRHESIIQRLGSFVAAKKPDSGELWHHVLAGWLAQTQAAFESSQFELRRIARQALPGLVRLCVWCDCIPLLSIDRSMRPDAKPSNESSVLPSAWAWTCWRHALLHMQFIRQVSSSKFSGPMESSLNDLVSQIRVSSAHRNAQRDAEAAVASVEAVVMAFLSSNAADGVWDHPLRVVIGTVYSSIESSYQDPSLGVDRDAPRDGSLDRLFSIALVQLLPSLSSRLPHSSSPTLSRMLLRISLSWLVTDDMFRWITIDKRSAHSALIVAVSRLVSIYQVAMPDAELVVSTLDAVAPVAGGELRLQLRDSLVGPVTSINVSLWKSVSAIASDNVHTKIMVNLALLAASEQRNASGKPTSDQPVEKSEWDDWDGGEELPKAPELRPSAVSTEDTSAIVLTTLQSSLASHELQTLRSALRSVADDAACRSELLELAALMTTL